MNGFELIINVLSWTFMISGSIFMLIGAIGTVRFPDFWTRLHAVSVTDTGGVLLLSAGMMMQAGFTLVTAKLFFSGVFLFITGPTATDAIANAALVSGFFPKVKEVPHLPKTEHVSDVDMTADLKPKKKAEG